MIEFISRLPQGYQEVEYIQSSGTQFIDTGFVPNDNTEIILVFTNNNATTGNYDCIFGTRTNASNDNTFALWIDPNRRFGAFYGTGQSITSFPTSINATAKHTATMKGNVAEIDSVSITCPVVSSSPTYSFYIGACNTAGTADYFSKILIYESKIYDNVTLVRDFVPCYRKADNVAGLYDLVNNVFYTNAGSGVFAVGSNTGEIVITPGGVISFSAALRRRMMMGGRKKMWTITVNHTPPNYHSIDAWTKVSVGDVVLYDGTYTFPDGTNIVCWADANLYNKTRIKIVVDDVTVASGTAYGPAVTYNYTLQSNCLIRKNVDTNGPGGQIFITTI